MTSNTSAAQIIWEQLNHATTNNLKPDHWEVGINTLKKLFSIGVVERMDPSSFLIAGFPVRVDESDPEKFNLISNE